MSSVTSNLKEEIDVCIFPCLLNNRIDTDTNRTLLRYIAIGCVNIVAENKTYKPFFNNSCEQRGSNFKAIKIIVGLHT